MINIDRWYRDDCVLGVLTIDNFRCFTLELPNRNNEQDVSCIPSSQYEYYYRESPSNGPCLELRDVPNRLYIQVHAGNFTKNTHGCILVGDSVTFLDSDSIPDVTNSRKTLKKLLSIAGNLGVIRLL